MTENYKGPDRRAQQRRDSGRRRTDFRRVDLARMLGTAFFCTFVVMGLLAFGVVNTNERAADNGKRTSDGVACVLHEVSEHRDRTHAYQEAITRANGIPFDIGPQPPEFPNIENVCAQFIPSVTTTPGGTTP